MSGLLFVVAAPSGAGKTTLVRELLARDEHVRLSVSYTTRQPRPGEMEGREYHFVNIEKFEAMRNHGDFVEWAKVHDNLYGTSRAWLNEQLASGQDVLLEIDWQGAQQLRAIFSSVVGIFVLPPSLEILETRLRGRQSDSAEVIQKRLDAALSEMRHVNEFDYVIINNDLQTAYADIAAVVRAARLRMHTAQLRYPCAFEFLNQQ